MDVKNGLRIDSDGKSRCWWHGGHPDYLAYHDEEWGQPVGDDIRLFEKICLEGFQSGLSWLTILRKRENFRKAFAGFDFQQIARYGKEEVEVLLQDAGIIRHRKKIESTINNARRALELVDEKGSLASYFWSFEPEASERPADFSYDTMIRVTQTPTSKALSKDLKKRGWSFVGPTTAYAFMQAMGLVNDHLQGCICREPVERMRAGFERPV